MKTSITDTAACAEIISMNPCTVQRNTELEYYWKRGAYRPPYLWSILSILADAPLHISAIPLVADRTGDLTIVKSATTK